MQVRVQSKNKLCQIRKYQKPKAMKNSSILMSSFAALLILISVSENALKRTDNFSDQDQAVIKVQPMVAINETPSATSVHTVSKNTYDFSYLKFYVSDFETFKVRNDEMPEEADFTFLKFKVSDFVETEPKSDVLPENADFDYLKFDVNSFTSIPYTREEFPSANLDYLKFDVQKFVQNDSAGKNNELPEAGIQ
jgi:hypothetical protein